MNFEEWCIANNKQHYLKRWDYQKNEGQKPSDFGFGSAKKVWWKCSLGHEFRKEINGMVRGGDAKSECCPYCANQKVLAGFNDFATKCPELLKEWDYEKNTINPTEIVRGSGEKVWWKCSKGHSYDMTVCQRSCNNYGCPVCSGKRVIKGVNDFASNYPELLQEWDYEKNAISPDEVTKNSSRDVFWKCKTCGHEWKAAIEDRTTSSQGCIICGQKTGVKKRIKAKIEERGSFADNYPELVQQWDYSKNEKDPSEYCTTSHNKVWWLCDKGHSYYATIAGRVAGNGCPVCAGKQVVEGYNDLASQVPEIVKYWDYEHNYPLKPGEVTPGSNRKAWWICETCKQSYKMIIGSRVNYNEKYDCYKCAKKRGAGTKIKHLTEAGNNLLELEPELSKEWHSVRNGLLKPENVTRYSTKAVWWLCPTCGHEWKSSIGSRAAGEGCHNCAKSYKTSEPEQLIYFYIHNYFSDAINSYKNKEKGISEIDIYIPSLLLGIEYDGQMWHKNVKKDIKKTEILRQEGIFLIRVREEECPPLSDGSFQIIVEDYYKFKTNFDDTIKRIFDFINKKYKLDIKPDIDCKRDYKNVAEMFAKHKEGKTVAALKPELISEWHPLNNGTYTPYNTNANGQRKIWWKCSKCGFEWQCKISGRTKKNNPTGCPECSFKKQKEFMQERALKRGENDVRTLRPDIAKLWDEKKNEKTPSDYTICSHKRVWWICKEGHSYKQSIDTKIRQKEGCPYCSGKRVLEGFNDLATVAPEIAKQWHPTKNADLLPTQFTKGSSQKIWWHCEKCNNDWLATIDKRTMNRGCPFCAGKKVAGGFNDLATTNPEVLNDWDYEKNGQLLPTTVSNGSQKIVWWKCHKCGNEWQSSIAYRLNTKGCQICRRNKIPEGQEKLF